MEVFFLIMARPKSSDVDAKKRLSEAFWDLLSRQPYNQITVKSLCSTAKVNHNTIYYYFSSWEDMVVSFFLDNLDEEIPQTIFDAVVTGNINPDLLINDQSLILRWQRVRLFAGSESEFLKAIFLDSVRRAWLHKLGLKEADLHTEEKMDLDFILNGISSLLGNKEYSAPSYFTGFFRRNLGKGVRETLYQLSLKNQSFDNAAF